MVIGAALPHRHELDTDYFSFHYSTSRMFGRKFEALFGPPRDPADELLHAVERRSRVLREAVREPRCAGELCAFFLRHKWWWLTPMVLTLMTVGALVIFAQSSAIAPLIYTLF